MFAGGKCSQREVEMKSRWDRHHNGVYRRVIERGPVAAIPRPTTIPTPESFGLGLVATCVATDDVFSQGTEVSAMDTGNKAAPEKGEV